MAVHRVGPGAGDTVGYWWHRGFMVGGSVGRRIATYRRRRGLSQAALAGLVGRSESWLSQVERGIRSVDRMTVLLDLARVLQVDVASLTGTPWRHAPNGASVGSALDGVRGAFTSYEVAFGARPALQTESTATIRAEAAHLHARYQAADYATVVGGLPSLLTAADRLNASGSANGSEAGLVYVEAYVLAAKLVTKLGDGELATVASDRCVNVAVTTGSQVAVALSMYQVAAALLRGDRLADAERVAITMAERADRDLRSDRPGLVSAVGALWLLGAVIAARRTDRSEAEARLSRANHLAGLLGQDTNHGFTAFGPTNVAIHRVSVAAELGDAGGALTAAADVDPTRLPASLASRRAQVHVDLAWANAQRRRDAEATLHLLDAERIAPGAIRYNVITQEIVREMLARGTKTQTRALADLAERAGLLH